MPVRVKTPSPIKNRKNSQSLLQDLDKEIESLLEEVGRNYPIGGIPEICEENTKIVEDKKRKNNWTDIVIDEEDEDKVLSKEIKYEKDKFEEKLQIKLEKNMGKSKEGGSFEVKGRVEEDKVKEEIQYQILVKEKNEENKEQALGEIKENAKNPVPTRRIADVERKNQEKSPFASKKAPSKSPIRSFVTQKNEEKWISPRKQAQRMKHQSIDITLDPQNTKHSQNIEENSSDIEKSAQKAIKSLKNQSICSEIDALLAENPRASPMIIPNKNKIAPSPIKKSSSPIPSFKKHKSIEDIKINLKSFDESKEKLKKNNKPYEKLTKIVNKTRPDITEIKDQDKKPKTKKIEEIDNHLWEDAQRRASIYHIPEEENTDIIAGLTSQRMLARKFMKEFKENLLKKKEIPESFEFNDIIGILKDMSFIIGETEEVRQENEGNIAVKFWKFIKNHEKIDKDRLVSALLSVLSFYPSQLFQDYNKEDTEFYNFYTILQSFSLEDELKLGKFFMNMKDTRKAQHQPVKDTQVEEFSFKPQLNNDSETLGKKKREEIGRPMSQKRLDFFMKERKKIEEKSEKSKINKEEEELKKCTFRPKTLKKTDTKTGQGNEHRGLTLYEKSKVTKDFNIKSSLEIELEKSLAECTFAPKVNTKKKLKEEPSGLYSKSVQQQITRMQKAREEEARKKAILEGINPNKIANIADIEGELRPKSPRKMLISHPESKTPDKFMPQINFTDFDNALTERPEDCDKSKF
ncbi:hypothetical protein SteCoe_23608 [Stentor coeruleus]|uniref:Uncharacterized protein n=1 Tax=Stentor coeruleus TaxID=5963 RepID=A0A1R2BJG8_9CILI|nr:hypothetical protein SteCoe_23608 [Stentor coeruleus]